MPTEAVNIEVEGTPRRLKARSLSPPSLQAEAKRKAEESVKTGVTAGVNNVNDSGASANDESNSAESAQTGVAAATPEPLRNEVGNQEGSSGTTGSCGVSWNVALRGGQARTGEERSASSERSDDGDEDSVDGVRGANPLDKVVADVDKPVTEKFSERWQIDIASKDGISFKKTRMGAKEWTATLKPGDLQRLLKQIASFCVHGPHGVGPGGTPDAPKRAHPLNKSYPGLTNSILKEIGYVMAEVYINRGGIPKDAWYSRVNGGNLWPYPADDTSGQGNPEKRKMNRGVSEERSSRTTQRVQAGSTGDDGAEKDR